MPKFKVTAVYHTYCTAFVEADNEDDAYDLAREQDGIDFKPSNEVYDWYIDQVVEVEE